MLELLLLFDPARIPARMAIDQDLAPNDAHHRSVDHVEGVAGPGTWTFFPIAPSLVLKLRSKKTTVTTRKSIMLVSERGGELALSIARHLS